jgi:3-hydroxy-9,10-secoandrosta-1,3,5(10)-triene-9,17-dione monooxygenase reductase component
MDERNDRVTGVIDSARLRHVLGHLPTGVAIIAALTDVGPVWMAANSVASVSLDPPLILFCPSQSSTTWPDIRAAGCFCINVMASQHEETTRRFARKGVDRFAGVDYRERSTGPGLTDALAWIDCRIDAEHDAGDHRIVVARVLTFEAAPAGDPLVFFRGRYGSFRDAD